MVDIIHKRKKQNMSHKEGRLRDKLLEKGRYFKTKRLIIIVRISEKGLLKKIQRYQENLINQSSARKEVKVENKKKIAICNDKKDGEG